MPHEQRFQRTKSLLYRYGIWLTVMRLFFCLVLPWLRASGKDEAMKRTPKTPIDIDYDLWTTEDGKCMVRVKSTGEVTEVSRDVMKALRAEEKRLRRSYTGGNSDDKEEAEDKNSILSLDALPDDDVKTAAWLADPHDHIKDVELKMLEKDLMQLLTPSQLSIYLACIIKGQTPTNYAKDHNMKRQSVNDAITLIRKKAKKFF